MVIQLADEAFLDVLYHFTKSHFNILTGRLCSPQHMTTVGRTKIFPHVVVVTCRIRISQVLGKKR
jgi:hypothetical protein